MSRIKNRVTTRATLVVVLCLAINSNARSSGGNAESTPLSNGTWTGPGIVLTISNGSGVVEFDCAHGTISAPIVVNNNGEFSAAGTYEPETGGPSGPSIAPPENGDSSGPQTTTPNAARYEGRVDHNTLTLVVKPHGSEAAVGRYILNLGGTGHLRKCQ